MLWGACEAELDDGATVAWRALGVMIVVARASGGGAGHRERQRSRGGSGAAQEKFWKN